MTIQALINYQFDVEITGAKIKFSHPIIESYILSYHSFDYRITAFNYKLN